MPERDSLAAQQPFPPRIPLKRGGFLDFSRSPLIMGVLNATPDSFYGRSRISDPTEGLERALRMVEDGADILDIGGESTRPGSAYVKAEEELLRVVPLVEAIRKRSDVPISIDTRKAEVARRAIEAGGDIINDVSALRDDSAMAETAVRYDAPVILMHMRGTPLTMQEAPHYDDAVKEVVEELEERISAAVGRGIPRDRIIIDPGIGFGKRDEDNLSLLKGIPKLKSLGYPVLIGVSRKGFLGRVAGGRGVEERIAATVAANTYALLSGANILRVHDVREATDMKRVLDAIASVD